jgi:hypothetical protein
MPISASRMAAKSRWSRHALRKVLISSVDQGVRAAWAAVALVRASRGILVYWGDVADDEFADDGQGECGAQPT